MWQLFHMLQPFQQMAMMDDHLVNINPDKSFTATNTKHNYSPQNGV